MAAATGNFIRQCVLLNYNRYALIGFSVDGYNHFSQLNNSTDLISDIEARLYSLKYEIVEENLPEDSLNIIWHPSLEEPEILEVVIAPPDLSVSSEIIGEVINRKGCSDELKGIKLINKINLYTLSIPSNIVMHLYFKCIDSLTTPEMSAGYLYKTLTNLGKAFSSIVPMGCTNMPTMDIEYSIKPLNGGYKLHILFSSDVKACIEKAYSELTIGVKELAATIDVYQD
jgi:hypothetical protein